MRTAATPQALDTLRRRLQHALVLTLLAPWGCSPPSGGKPDYGTAQVELRAPKGVTPTGGTYLVTDRHGDTVRFGTLDDELSPLQLVLPQGPDYVLSVNTLARKPRQGVSAECEGFLDFDVFRREVSNFVLRLVCAGLWPAQPDSEANPAPHECGLASLVAGPLSQVVGTPIHASAAAIPTESMFTWSVTDPNLGHYSHPPTDNVSQTSFICDAPGTTTLTLSVSAAGCRDEASVAITCTADVELDAGP